jgi:hypothetical protein
MMRFGHGQDRLFAWRQASRLQHGHDPGLFMVVKSRQRSDGGHVPTEECAVRADLEAEQRPARDRPPPAHRHGSDPSAHATLVGEIAAAEPILQPLLLTTDEQSRDHPEEQRDDQKRRQGAEPDRESE